MQITISPIFGRDRSVMITNDRIAKLTDTANFQDCDLVHTSTRGKLPDLNVTEPHEMGSRQVEDRIMRPR